MGKPYSDDLRERVVAAIEAGHTRVKVAELYNMALSTVGGFIKRKRETGSVSPEKFGGHKTFALECPSEDFLIPLNHLDSMEPILIRGGAYIVDGQEPGEVRPRSLEMSERPD